MQRLTKPQIVGMTVGILTAIGILATGLTYVVSWTTATVAWAQERKQVDETALDFIAEAREVHKAQGKINERLTKVVEGLTADQRQEQIEKDIRKEILAELKESGALRPTNPNAPLPPVATSPGAPRPPPEPAPDP